MQPLVTNHHNLPLNLGFQGMLLSKAYHLQPSQNIHSFVFTSCNQSNGDTLSRYDIIFIDNPKQLIYEFESCELNLHHDFEQGLFDTLEKENEEALCKRISTVGFGIVSESTISLQNLLCLHALENINDNIVALLNQDAVRTLKQLGLPVIPRVYNWLVEVPVNRHYIYRHSSAVFLNWFS